MNKSVLINSEQLLRIDWNCMVKNILNHSATASSSSDSEDTHLLMIDTEGFLYKVSLFLYVAIFCAKLDKE